MTESNRIGELARLSGRVAVVLEFGAGYCPPCKQLAPVVRELADLHQQAVRVIDIDIEREPELAQHFGVRSVPTLLTMVGGQVVDQQVGFSGRRRVEELFARAADHGASARSTTSAR